MVALSTIMRQLPPHGGALDKVLPEQDRQNRITRTGMPREDCQDRTARTGVPEQESQGRTARAGRRAEQPI